MRAAVLPSSILASLALALLPAPGWSDVVTTADGLSIEGSVEKAADGSLVVTTEDGPVRLAADRVRGVVPGEGPRAKAARDAAALAATDADGHFRLGVRLDAQGLSDLARRQYEAVIAVAPDHAAARRALGYERSGSEWVTTAEARQRSGLVLFGGRWLLPAEADAAGRAAPLTSVSDLSLLSTMRVAATGEAGLARAAAVSLLTVEAEKRLEPATLLLLDRDPNVRRWAAAYLGSLGDERALRALLVSAVRDANPSVRKAAVLSAASFGHDDTAIPLAKGLDSMHLGIVANAAQALATLGDARGITYIVRKINAHSTSGRVVVEVLNKTSYVRDYDVEIAQFANIANPVIGTAIDGMVLDVKVVDAGIEQTTIEPVLVDSFNALSGAHARNADDVNAWWKEHGASVPKFGDSPSARKPRTASSKPN